MVFSPTNSGGGGSSGHQGRISARRREKGEEVWERGNFLYQRSLDLHKTNGHRENLCRRNSIGDEIVNLREGF